METSTYMFILAFLLFVIAVVVFIAVLKLDTPERRARLKGSNTIHVETITRTTMNGETTVHVQKYDMPYGYYVSIVPITSPEAETGTTETEVEGVDTRHQE